MNAAGGVTGPASRFPITFFASHGANTKRQEDWSLEALARRIGTVSKGSKAELPWLKAATFGDIRTDKGCLRHDDNVLAVTGVEADYDAGGVPFADALEIATKAGILAVVYTSPSHTEAAPRWRVVCPFSHPLPPADRARMLARLNGLYRGLFAGESWTLSQSYYFGCVDHNPAHRVELIDGTPIDLHDDLDRIAIGKPNTIPKEQLSRHANGHDFQAGPLDEAELLRQITNGKSYHLPCTRLLGRWARQGIPYMDARANLLCAFDSVFPPDMDARWEARRADVDRCLDDIYGKQAKARDARTNGQPPPKPATTAPHDAHKADAAEPQPDAEPSDPNPTITAVIDRFNKLYAVLNEAGKAIVLQRGYDAVMRRRVFYRMAPADLKTLYMNERVQVGTDDKGNAVTRSTATVWLNHPARRQFIHGVTFDPTNQAQTGVLNLWEGYTVQPAPGDWSRLHSHILDIICGGDQALFSYVLGWMARMVQHPAERGEVAIVMRGVEGCGKGTLAKVLKTIIGHHSLAISNAKHLVGNFNAHLRDVVFLFADEAFFAGDRAHVGVLKSIITEESLTIEAKFATPIEVPNYLHVMMASNEEWVVPASIEARRFCMLEVLDTVVGNHAHFAAIWAQMEAGGYAAMLHDLFAYDLSTFNVRAVPQTAGLERQRQLSLPTKEAWWLDCLERGYVFRSRHGLEAVFATWHDEMSTELLFASYSEFAKAKSERHPDTRETLGRFFVSLGAKAKRKRGGIVGEHLADEQSVHGGFIRKAKPVQAAQPCGYVFGPLNDARSAFATRTKTGGIWDNGLEAEPN